jgi:hypothetical protein
VNSFKYIYIDIQAIEYLETTNQSQLAEDKKEMKDFNGNIVASTATQRFLLFVGMSFSVLNEVRLYRYISFE